MTDYATNRDASARRWQKAHILAAWAWKARLSAAQLDLYTDPQWSALTRRAIGRPASDRTRAIVQALLVVKEAWAAAHPDHPDARRTVLTDDEAAELATTRRGTR